jgi:hypothetical protein
VKLHGSLRNGTRDIYKLTFANVEISMSVGVVFSNIPRVYFHKYKNGDARS